MRATDTSIFFTPPSEHNVHLTGFGADDVAWLGGKVRTTVREMFVDRGYEIVDGPAIEAVAAVAAVAADEAVAADGGGGGGKKAAAVPGDQGASFYVWARADAGAGEVVLAKIVPCERVGIANANVFFSALSAAGVRRGVLVAHEFSSHHASLANLYRHISVEHFTTGELLNNPTRHELVCRHEKLSPEETKDFKERFAVDGAFNCKCIPALTPGDIMTRYHNFAPGTVVRVRRSELTCVDEPQLDSFRIVRN